MFKALKISAVVISTVMLFSACSKEENIRSTNQPPSTPLGELSVKIGGETFKATSVTARNTTDGNFVITALGSDNKVLQFTLTSFIGNADYPLGPGMGNRAVYSYTQSGSQISFSTDLGAGSLTITNYDSNENKFDGSFWFEALQTGGSSALSFENGKFEDVPIIALAEPEPGKAKFYANGFYHDTDSAYAQLNNNNSIEVFLFLEGYLKPIRIIGLGYDNGSASTITFGVPFNENANQQLYFRASQDYGEISMTGNMETVSGHIAKNDLDLELDYRDIPIIRYPMEVQPGELLLKYSGNTVVFTHAESYGDYAQAPTTITTHFKATNSTGDSLHFSYSYPGEYTPNYWVVGADQTGISGSLKYYSAGTLVKSEIGYYGRGANNSFGFDPKSSDSGAMRMRGVNMN